MFKEWGNSGLFCVPVWCDPESALTAVLHWSDVCSLPVRNCSIEGSIASVRGGEDSCFLVGRSRGFAFLTSATASSSGMAPWASVTQCMVLVGNGADLHQLSCYGTADHLAPITLLLLFVCLPACASCPALISASVAKISLFSLGCS